MSKSISTCSVIILKKLRFPKNLLRVWYILGPWEFFSDFWGKIFRKAVKTDSYTFRQTLWLKTNLLENFLHSFGLWLMHFFDWWQFYRCKSFKTAFYDFKEHSDKEELFWETLPYFFRTMSNSFPDFRQKLYREVVQTVLYLFRKHFQDADFFNCFVFGATLNFEQFSSDMRHKFFCKVVETAFSMSRRTLWWKAFFRKVLQLIFGLWAKHFLNLGEIFTEK